MATGWILILAVLVLGGMIATIGDRLGSRVGKARLSLFNLRPKKTAVLVTILTGSIISATTLALLLGLSGQLRKGLFELESIQRDSRRARQDLEKTQIERRTLEKERDQARIQQEQAKAQLGKTQKDLTGVQKNLDKAVAKQKATQSRLSQVANRAESLRLESARLLRERQVLIVRRDSLQVEIEQRRRDVQLRDAELRRRNQELQSRDQEIAQQDRELQTQAGAIASQRSQLQTQTQSLQRQTRDLNQRKAQVAERDRQIAQQTNELDQGRLKLQSLEKAQESLTQDIYRYEQALLSLRQGVISLRRGDFALVRRAVLSSRVVRVLTAGVPPDVVNRATQQAVDQLLRDADQEAQRYTRPGITAQSNQVIRISTLEVERLRQELSKGQEVVVRILSAGNYLVNESQVEVFADVVPNRVVLGPGQQLSATLLNSSADKTNWPSRLDTLRDKALFRAQNEGMLSDRIIIGESRATLNSFSERIQRYDKPLLIQAVTSAPIKVAGPLSLLLVAYDNGAEVFRSDSALSPDNGPLSVPLSVPLSIQSPDLLPERSPERSPEQLPNPRGPRSSYILGLDPGRDNCGIALLQLGGGDEPDRRQVQLHEVVPTPQALVRLKTLAQAFPVTTLVIGNQTTSKQWLAQLAQDWPDGPIVVPINERNSSLEARDRYWQLFPPQGLQRLMPQGMRQPPRPVDDIVAILLIERYLDSRQ